MSERWLTETGKWVRFGNLAILALACILVLVMPLKKEIWYDETVSVLCANGISHDTPGEFARDSVLSSAQIEQQSSPRHVFDATVNDNGNSYLYNILLHGFIRVAGRSLNAYMLFSKLVSIIALVVFFGLSQLFFRGTVFTGISVLLLAMDIDFLGMSHEIRAYSLGILFVLLAAYYLHHFLFQSRTTIYFWWAGFFSACAVLTHFLAIYMVLVFLVALLAYKPRLTFTVKNLLVLSVPLAMLAVFLLLAYPGLQTMSRQNHDIQLHAQQSGFSPAEVAWRAMRFLAINFKVALPAFTTNKIVLVGSFLLVWGLFLAGRKYATLPEQLRSLSLLFLPGLFAVTFLAVLCLKSHHYTALYYRYFSFCLPFCALFAAYVLCVFWSNAQAPNLLKAAVSLLILVPVITLFAMGMARSKAEVKYNHIAIASQIVNGHITRISVPEWRDAMLIHSFLPKGYNLTYFRTMGAGVFTLYTDAGPLQVPVTRIDR